MQGNSRFITIAKITTSYYLLVTCTFGGVFGGLYSVKKQDYPTNTAHTSPVIVQVVGDFVFGAVKGAVLGPVAPIIYLFEKDTHITK